MASKAHGRRNSGEYAPQTSFLEGRRVSATGVAATLDYNQTGPVAQPPPRGVHVSDASLEHRRGSGVYASLDLASPVPTAAFDDVHVAHKGRNDLTADHSRGAGVFAALDPTVPAPDATSHVRRGKPELLAEMQRGHGAYAVLDYGAPAPTSDACAQGFVRPDYRGMPPSGVEQRRGSGVYASLDETAAYASQPQRQLSSTTVAQRRGSGAYLALDTTVAAPSSPQRAPQSGLGVEHRRGSGAAASLDATYAGPAPSPPRPTGPASTAMGLGHRRGSGVYATLDPSLEPSPQSSPTGPPRGTLGNHVHSHHSAGVNARLALDQSDDLDALAEFAALRALGRPIPQSRDGRSSSVDRIAATVAEAIARHPMPKPTEEQPQRYLSASGSQPQYVSQNKRGSGVYASLDAGLPAPPEAFASFGPTKGAESLQRGQAQRAGESAVVVLSRDAPYEAPVPHGYSQATAAATAAHGRGTGVYAAVNDSAAPPADWSRGPPGKTHTAFPYSIEGRRGSGVPDILNDGVSQFSEEQRGPRRSSQDRGYSGPPVTAGRPSGVL